MTRRDATAPQALPVVPFGPVAVTRLIAGGNPFCGNSHVDAATNAAMAAYHTPEHVGTQDAAALERYDPADPPRMAQTIQATSRTCLAFKILAASPSWREARALDALENHLELVNGNAALLRAVASRTG